MYVAYHDGGGRYASGPAPYEPGRQFWGRGTGGGPPATTPEDSQGVAAIETETGKIQWRYQLTQNSLSAGVLATAGGVLRGRAVQLRAAGLTATGCTVRNIWT